jgi:hypothetical protein
MMRHRKNWVRLDNASNIFLAAMSRKDTKVFRFSAELSETIDPDILQQALNKVYDQYLLYHSVLRRGLFWYYLEESDLRPIVQLDTNPSCEALYHFDKRELLFRVIYWKKRISIEVFHVLSDGTGALWFLQDLLKEYILLKHEEVTITEDITTSDLTHQQLLEDSFATYFRKKGKSGFLESVESAIQSLSEIGKKTGFSVSQYVKKPASMFMPVAEQRQSQNIYQVTGTYTSDNRPRVVELEMPVKDILTESKKIGASLTIYLTALFIESVKQTAKDFKGTETIAVSVPVNLRQFFPSHTARNFFSTTRLTYTYSLEKENSLTEICQELKNQLEPQLTKESLEEWLTRLIMFEYHPIGRIIIRPLKDIVLKLINKRNNKNLTLAISNLGRVAFPEEIDPYVNQVYFHTIAVRPQFCAISHGDVLTISFTSPFVETDIQRAYIGMLTDKSIPVTVTVNKVTAEELGGDKK